MNAQTICANVYLATFSKFLYELLKRNPFAAFFLVRFDCLNVFKICQIFDKVIGKKIIQKIRRGNVIFAANR